MPDHLTPGVFVEDDGSGPPTIEGVNTSTAGFVGPTRFGPVRGEPELLTSFLEFERIYGGIDQLDFGAGLVHNHLAHAVRAFFENGGRRLYVVRAFGDPGGGLDRYEHVATAVLNEGDSSKEVALRARYPGAAGAIVVTFDVRLGGNIVVASTRDRPGALTGAAEFDTAVVVTDPDPRHFAAELVWLRRTNDPNRDDLPTLELMGAAHPDPTREGLLASELTTQHVHLVTIDVSTSAMGRFMDERTWDGLAPHPSHRSSLAGLFAPNRSETDREPFASRSTELFVPLVIEDAGVDGPAVVQNLLVQSMAAAGRGMGEAEYLYERLLRTTGLHSRTRIDRVQQRVQLAGGADAGGPDADDYLGDELGGTLKRGLKAFEGIDDISTVAAPGSTAARVDPTTVAKVQQHLIAHAERMRYRIAVLDAPENSTVGQIRTHRAQIDSAHAALYYPWVKILDPVTGTEIITSPAGFVAGIYARSDIERGVHKAPANQVLRLATGLELMMNHAEQDLLNPEGINCLRFFEGRGYRVSGARTLTSDPEWKYVNVRRYFAYLERSIDSGLGWVVFEPNGPELWATVRRTIEEFLLGEWRSGALIGGMPEEAFFVRVDRTTMTQGDIDNGRLICIVGVAPLRPAEFVIVRIDQKTSTAS